MKKHNEKGSTVVIVFLVILLVAAVGFAAYRIGSSNKTSETKTVQNTPSPQEQQKTGIDYKNPSGYSFKYEDANWRLVRDEGSRAEFASGGMQGPLESNDGLYIVAEKVDLLTPSQSDTCYPDVFLKSTASNQQVSGPVDSLIDNYPAKQYVYDVPGTAVKPGEQVQVGNKVQRNSLYVARVGQKCFIVRFIASQDFFVSGYSPLSSFLGGFKVN